MRGRRMSSAYGLLLLPGALGTASPIVRRGQRHWGGSASPAYVPPPHYPSTVRRIEHRDTEALGDVAGILS